MAGAARVLLRVDLCCVGFLDSRWGAISGAVALGSFLEVV